MSNYTVDRLEDAGERNVVVEVGTHSLKPIVRTAIDTANEKIGELLFPQTVAEMITDVDGLESKEVTVTDGNFILEDVNATLNNGEYVGVILPQARNVSQISVTGTNLADLDLEYSINGLDWQKAEVSKDDGISMNTKVSATYVRLVTILMHQLMLLLMHFKLILFMLLKLQQVQIWELIKHIIFLILLMVIEKLNSGIMLIQV
ncbi:MAG: hypothetical protein ACLTAI_05535 [Thomasclavelia sp.]